MNSQANHDKLLCRVLSGPLTPALSNELDDWLRKDARHPVLLAQFMVLEDMIGAARKESSAQSILALLLESEENAEPIYVTRDADPTLREKVGVFFRDSHVRLFALAACLLIVVSGAFWALSTLIDTNTQPSTPQITGQQDQPDETVVPDVRMVATLTNTHNAQWADDALAPGSQLHPNQRLTLTQGFAEITTRSGAVAILEAPATIELLDNDNALRLQTGKLVGICETPSSKGFTVRTPHMDITDLGTRFGVDVTAYRATQVHVQKGEVHVLHTAASSHRAPMTLNAGQSARATAGSTAIVRIDYDTDRFASLSPQTIPLPGTGQGLAVGDIDPNWQVVAVDGEPMDTPQAVTVSGDENYSRHVANDPSTSQFISWSPEGEIPTGKLATYTLRTTISLPASMNPDGARLTMRCMVDNELLAVVVNGQRTPVSGRHFDVYDQWTEHTLTNPLQSGTNIIEFEVRNHPFEGATTNPVGLRLQWELRTEPWLSPVGDAVSHLAPCKKGSPINRASRLNT